MSERPHFLARIRFSAWAAFASALLVGLLAQGGLLERLERRTQDFRFAQRPPRKTRAKIVLVTVGDNAVNSAWPEPMAFWGTHLADVMAQARQRGAAVIGLDFIPAAAADKTVADGLDTALAQAKTPTDSVDKIRDFLPAALHAWPAFVGAIEEAQGRVVIADDPNMQTEQMEILRHYLDATHDAMGMARLQDDSEGAIRDAPLYTRNGNETSIGFAAQMAARARKFDPQDLPALRRMAGLPTGREAAASFGINYVGEPPGESFPALPAERVATGELTEKENALLQNAVVVIGATFDGSPDTHSGPMGRVYNGAEIQAQAVSTLLDGCALKRGPQYVETLATLTAGLLVAFVSIRFGFWPSLIGGLAGAAGWWLLAQGAFASRNYFLPVAGPTLGLLPFAVCHSLRSLEEAQRRREIVRLFGRSVSPAICDYLLEDPARLALGGETAEGTALFFDARGSTEFASRHDSEVVFMELNRLFGAVVPVIEAHGGLLYRYQGDGFLAVFGVPKPLADHRKAALDAAFAGMRAVRELNKTRKRVDGQAWRVGFGLHSGSMAYGNLGVAERAEFTVIGDTVNLAARMEGVNSELSSVLVVSAEMIRAGGATRGMRGPTSVSVKGIAAPIEVYFSRWEDVIAGNTGENANGTENETKNDTEIEHSEIVGSRAAGVVLPRGSDSGTGAGANRRTAAQRARRRRD